MRRIFGLTRRHRYLSAAIFAALGAATIFGVVGATGATEITHGISVTKGCVSPIKVGDAYACSYTIRNITDDAEDTLTIDSLVDIVHAAPQPGAGDVSSGNILGTVSLVLVNGATCIGGSGAGTVASPYTGATKCTLPFLSRINVQTNSFYTVQAADFALPNHALTDDVRIGWHDLCNDPAGTGNSNCNPNPPASPASSQAIIQQLSS